MIIEYRQPKSILLNDRTICMCDKSMSIVDIDYSMVIDIVFSDLKITEGKNVVYKNIYLCISAYTLYTFRLLPYDLLIEYYNKKYSALEIEREIVTKYYKLRGDDETLPNLENRLYL